MEQAFLCSSDVTTRVCADVLLLINHAHGRHGMRIIIDITDILLY